MIDLLCLHTKKVIFPGLNCHFHLIYVFILARHAPKIMILNVKTHFLPVFAFARNIVLLPADSGMVT